MTSSRKINTLEEEKSIIDTIVSSIKFFTKDTIIDV